MSNISKVNIENFKLFDGRFSLVLNPELNIIVGNNETGKSTILEAINLALSGIINGKFIKGELSQYLFNNQVEKRYIDSLSSSNPISPPSILIEVFLESGDYAYLEGTNNSERKNSAGVSLKIEFDNEYQGEYQELIKHEVLTIPIEYYKITWQSFARQTITSKSIPFKSILIDSSSSRYNNGSDIYISRIIKSDLGEKEKVDISQAYRKLKESFMTDKAVLKINERITESAQISEKSVEISVDLATKDAWENGLTTYVNEVPFIHIGKGEQCLVKTNLALAKNSSKNAGCILIEEPENHLSHSKLNQTIKSLVNNVNDKQIIITTHSSYVANKLGIDNLILLNEQQVTRFSDLDSSTEDYFKKLPGFDTLRLILSNKAILVEGPSDELIVQKAYMDIYNGVLPIENGIDVISTGLSFKRLLELAKKLNKKVAVITDNDTNYQLYIVKKYEDYWNCNHIGIFADKREGLNTLEPQFADANRDNFPTLCDVIGIDFSRYNGMIPISNYMKHHKTDWALKVFESKVKLQYPEYILNAIDWINE
ncbi:ATP-dependent nuclease [Carboxylicivirga caseinilyticus]|uniref:ATP-dependent nuclease n=1 Tax=Carboxylicivirga caseinilyticus TaxID=3417572 RepID=UPI003D33263D|nr:AAA family ATPase [Marinilabiliaceae bacterium A049]